ncbi:hypothetical protein BH93_11440 [Rhodococcoides fascians A25f]|uniref:hypothetical protein n=1 Tax=Rhodococcoides fascians TaxID=1828 RepID=UPI00068CAF36|nr:hypothetical protein [Rhodococcus fascians]QII05904.1 hypothetical protein BH93_11440 [Rhodococcus fascians A25f]
MVETKTIASVELVKVGKWSVSTGTFNATPHLLRAAQKAHASGAVPRPIIKLGHVDPRFDGEPALGQVENIRLADSDQTLVGDLVGVPAWLSDIAASAFPRRSIEAVHDVVMPDGTKYPLVLTAVSLLGVTRPGISTLADIGDLFGVAVAASAGTPVTLTRASAAPRGTDTLTARQRAQIKVAATRRRHRTATAALKLHESRKDNT